jgi:glutathione peroxidase
MAFGKFDQMEASSSIHQFKLPGIDGSTIDLGQFAGRKILLVNSASECGFTPQYGQLQELHENFSDKVAIIACPSNDFGAQEPGTNEQIRAFCSAAFGVKFPMSSKIKVIGDEAHEVFQWLARQEGSQEPSWNFCKYILDEHGQFVSFHAASTEVFEELILNALGIVMN